MNLKLILVATFLTISSAAHADFSPRDAVVRSLDGDPEMLSYEDASKACSALGKRLPTIRELVAMLQSEGLKLKEIGDPTAINYSSVSAVNPDGKVDSFSYDNSEFNPPVADFGVNPFWTSSSSSQGASDHYVLDMSSGRVGNEGGPFPIINGALCLDR